MPELKNQCAPGLLQRQTQSESVWRSLTAIERSAAAGDGVSARMVIAKLRARVDALQKGREAAHTQAPARGE